MMKQHIFAALVLGILLLPGLLPAQSAGLARDMDAALESEAVSWALAARFVLPAAGFDLEGGAAASPEAAAFRAAAEQGWLPKGAKPEGEPTIGGLSFLVMRAFDLPGGLLYRLFPGPRYACRELAYRGLLQDQIDPSRKVSGFALLVLIGRLLDETGDEI
jgi:hypothetical protein